MNFLGSCGSHLLIKAKTPSGLIVIPAEQRSNNGRWCHTMTFQEREIVSFIGELQAKLHYARLNKSKGILD